MRHTIPQYAVAFLGALQGKSGSERREAIRRFLFVLRKNKDWQKTNRIVKEVEKQELRAQGLRKVELESTDPVSQEIKKELTKIFGKKLFFKETMRPELLAGVKILVDGEILIDASGKRRLDLMFNKK